MYKYKLLRYSNAAVLSVRLLFPKPINAGVPCAFSLTTIQLPIVVQVVW